MRKVQSLWYQFIKSVEKEKLKINFNPSMAFFRFIRGLLYLD